MTTIGVENHITNYWKLIFIKRFIHKKLPTSQIKKLNCNKEGHFDPEIIFIIIQLTFLSCGLEHCVD